jgi:hypothetical protein
MSNGSLCAHVVWRSCTDAHGWTCFEQFESSCLVSGRCNLCQRLVLALGAHGIQSRGYFSSDHVLQVWHTVLLDMWWQYWSCARTALLPVFTIHEGLSLVVISVLEDGDGQELGEAVTGCSLLLVSVT